MRRHRHPPAGDASVATRPTVHTRESTRRRGAWRRHLSLARFPGPLSGLPLRVVDALASTGPGAVRPGGEAWFNAKVTLLATLWVGHATCAHQA